MTLRLKLVAFIPNALYDNTLHIQEYVHSLEHMRYKAAIFSILSEMYEKLKRLLAKTYKLGNPVCVHLLFTDLTLLNH